MRIDSPQSVGITSGFGVPTGGTINQVLSKVDNDNYDTQWTNISGATVPFTATTDITKGYAVRLIEDGTIITPDYTQNLATKGGYFGTSGDSFVNDYAYVNSTNQVLALSFINNLPILYVGTVNTDTQEITFSGGTQLSTDVKDPNVSASIHYDEAIGRALVAYKLTSNTAVKLISIQKSGTTYSKITEINTSVGNNVITEVRLTSNGIDPGNKFYVSTRTLAERVRLRDVTVGSSNIVTSLDESPNMPLAAESHDILQFHLSSILVVIYRSGQTFYNFWDASTNTWASPASNYLIYNGLPSNQTTDLRIFRKNLNYYAAYVGQDETALIKFNANQDAPPSSVQATTNFLLGEGMWFYPADEFRTVSGWTQNGGTTAFYTSNNDVNQIDLSLAFSGLPSEDYTTYWSTPATNGFFQDSVGNFYGLGFNSNDFFKLFWNYLETVNYLNSPIIGIAQQSGTTGSIVEVAVENSISNVNEGLIPSFNYYSNPDGSLSLNGDTYVGVALSPTQINVMFSNPAGNSIPSLSVIDNSIGDPDDITTPGRYIVPVSGTTGVFVGESNDYADYDGSSFTFTTPTNGDKVSIATGPNAGNVYNYSSGTTSWNLSAQVTTLPTSNWVIGGTYKQNDLVVYQNVLYQANSNIPANTAFVIGTTGTTWKQIGYGNVIPEFDSQELATDRTVGNNVDTDILTFTIPSAGIWEVTWQSNAEGTFGVFGNIVSAWVTDNSNNVIPNSSQRLHWGNNSSLSCFGSNTFRVSTTGPQQFKLRGRALNGGVFYAGSSQSTSQRTNVSWSKISGFLPSTGSITTSRSAALSTTLVGGGSVGQDMVVVNNSVGNIPLSNSGVWTLTAGVTYQLECSIEYDAGGSNQFQGDTTVMFVDATTNTELPNQVGAKVITPFFTGRGISRPGYTTFIYTPSTNQTIKLRVSFQSNPGLLLATTFVNQLGTTNVSQFMGTLSNSWSNGNTYPSGALVVNSNNLYQANNTILPGSGFNIGSSGPTWNTIGLLRNEGTWNVVPGTNNYSFSVGESNQSYVMWVQGSIPNGIIGWQAQVTVTNSNVPCPGVQYAWNYVDGGTPLRFLSIPNQIFGTPGTIVTAFPTPFQNPSTTFVFSIQNNTATTYSVKWGYVRLSSQ